MIELKQWMKKVLGSLSSINSKLDSDLIITRSFGQGYEVAVSPSNYGRLEIDFNTPQGYTPILPVVYDTTNVRLLFRSCYISGQNVAGQ